ncbi:ribonuclease 2-5A-domain-containing protein [Mycena albidolilacea]|uniref:Ribonuclease 2-5A-domain-containing protein n=1 Tax=Mycena albidolilacea TaxID=1033008 RepID=A0AAD6ZJZ3_9AGAR|nr:ribonuclease 2-5A-domain-containing protein [Mycena albidolilacea]
MARTTRTTFSYQNTKDDAYIQSIPNGEIISFKASSGTEDHSILWGLKFNNPIVAIFDLSAILPELTHATSMDQLPHLQSAYIGLVEETGSLFAMSPDRFPLVVFGGGGGARKHRVIKVIDEGPRELPSDVDAVTEERKRRGKAMKERNYGSEDARCLDRSSLYTDRRCLVGIRPLEGGDGDGPENRLKRLIDGAPTVGLQAVMHWDPAENVNTNTNTVVTGNGTPDGAGDKPGPGPALPGNSTLIEGREPAAEDLSFWPSIAFASAPVIVDVPTAAISVLAAPPTPTLPPPEESPPPLSPQVLATKKLSPLPTDVAEDADESGDENENENGDASALPGTKRKGRRGRRAKKKKPGVVDAGENNNSVLLSSEKENIQENLKPIENGLVVLPNGNSSNPLLTSGLSFSPTIPVVAPPVELSLVVSDHVLGSHGTVVYRGSLQGRAVAVKRLLQDFVTLASREVNILQESDDHPNTPDRDAWRDIAAAFDPKRALRQIAGGLRHLHGLKLVHRDIKPQNILVSAGAGGGAKAYRMLISDFGLCKKLDVDQTSFLPTSHGAMAAGTVGWRAPEILRGDVKLDEIGAGDDASVSSQGSAASGASSGTAGKPARLTKSGHPFGDRFEREANIMKGAKNLQGLERFGEEGEEAVDLISSMLHAEAHERPDTTTCLLHPFFWDPGRRLTFLQDASDRFEIMTRIPEEPYLLVLERGGSGIVGNDWLSRLDPLFLENLGKFRKYDGRSVQDLLRALRNKKHHYQDLPDKVKRNLGPMPEGFLAYFTRRFPRLFLHMHSVVGDTSLRTESMFRSYFELHD